MQKITPFLWFDDQAVEAAKFYVSIFKDAKIIDEIDDDASSVSFEFFGQQYIAFNGGPYFRFTPAISLYVDCTDQVEVDYYWDILTEGGEESQCGWLIDKYGISWQIVPSILSELLNHPDPIKAQKAMDAMLQMKKLDIAKLLESIQ